MSEEAISPEVENVEPSIGEAVETENVEQPTGDNPVKEPIFSEEGQSVFNAKMAEAKREKREIEQKLAQQQEELDRIRSQQPQETRPNVPEIKDKFDYDSDEEYFRAISDRDKAIADGAKFDAKQEVLQQQAQYQQQQALQAEAQEAQKLYVGYLDNAEKNGVGRAKAEESAAALVQFGFNDNGLGRILLAEPDAGLIVPFVASNVDAMDSLTSASLHNVGRVIDSIRAKAAALKPNVTEAPDPIGSVGGSAVPPAERGPKGASFE